MKIKYYIQFLFLIIGFNIVIISCTKDIGNYDYQDLNKLVEVTNLLEEVNAVYGSELKFIPEIKFSKDGQFDASKYSYEWSFIGPNGLGGSKLSVFSEAKDLNLVTDFVPAGRYTAYFSITDKVSGVKYRKPFFLKVVNEYNEGWLMMNEVGGKARVDMLSLTSSGEFELVLDILDRIGSGLVLEGKPEMIYTYATGLLIGPDNISYGLYLGTDKMTTKIHPDTFKWTKTMGLSYEMYGTIPNGFFASNINQKSGSAAYLIGDESLYYYERAQNIYYSAPVSYINDEKKEFEVSPYSYARYGIFYDKTNSRFVKHSGIASSCTVLPDPAESSKLFSFRTGMDLIYMKGVSYNGDEVFSILKDKSTGAYYLARFSAKNNAQTYYAEIANNEIKNADFFEVSPEFGYIFFAVGGKLYQYDMVYKGAPKLMADFGNQKISFLDFYEFKNMVKYTGSNKLMVGFYNPSISNGTEGSLNIYTVPGLNGDLLLDNTYTGFGRIKDLTYRER